MVRHITCVADGRNPWKTVHTRFFSKVQKSDSCWLWTGHKDPNGYGRIAMGRGYLEKSHRMSYILHKGQIQKGLVVMHSCDTPSCVNPEHLEAGTYSQNLRDAYARKLHPPRGKARKK